MENPKLSVRKHKQKMFLESAERTNHYGLRKLSIGTASVLLSTMLWMGTNGAVASADTVDSQPATTETTKASSDTGTATEEKATNASTADATATSTTSANATAATSTSEDNAATNVAASLATATSEADNTPEETTSTNEQTGLVHHKKVQSTTTIAYKTKYVADYNMMIGYRDIKQDGQDGKTVTYLEWDEDASGNKTNETTSEETTPAVDEIYAIGTAEGTPAIDKYQTTYVNNRNLEKGTQVVKQKGQDGFSVYYHDVDPDTGEVDFDQRKEINIQRVDEIIEVGTKIPYTETKHMTFRWVDVSTGKTIVEKQITAKVGETINLGDFAEYPEGYTGLEYEWWDGSTTKFPQFKSDSQIAPKNFNGTMADNGWMPKTFVVQNSIMDYSKYKVGDLEGNYQGSLMTLPEIDLDNYVYVAPAIKTSDIYKRTRTINLHKPDGTIETTINVKTFTMPTPFRVHRGTISVPLWSDPRLKPDLKAVPYTDPNDSNASGVRYYDTTGDLIIDTSLRGDKSWVVNPTKWAQLQNKYAFGGSEQEGEKLVPFNWITDTTNEVVPYVYNTDIGKIMPIESSPDLTEEERDKLTEEERNQIDNLDWITSGTWNGYITPQITGWRATRDSVDAYDPKFSDKDVVIDIYYVADPANGDITYIDDTTGKTLNKSDFEEGKVDGLINYTTADKIADYEKQGYKLVSNDFEDGSTKFKVDGNNYFVHLVHTYEDKTLYKKATQTVHYVDNKGAKVFDDKVQSDGQAFTATQTIDKVTGEVVKTTDWTGTKTFDAETTPFKEGYHADKKFAGGLTATVGNPDVVDTVVYTPNGKLIPVDPNGNEIPNAPQPTYPTDPNDPTKVVPNEPIPDVPHWTPVDPSPVTPTDPGKDTPVPYRQQVTGDITYYDDTTGKTLTHDDFKTGLVGDKVDYTTADKIKSYEDKGYKLVSNDFSDGTTAYKKDGNSYAVHLVHTYEDKTLYKKATQTVHYVDNKGAKVFEDKKQADDKAFTATQTIDKVTGEVVKTTDWAGTKTFGQEDTPFKEGYHADKKVAGGLTATVDNPDVEDTVVFTKDEMPSEPVKPTTPDTPDVPEKTYGLTEYFVDEDDNELVPSENKGTNYKSGDKYDVTGDAKEIPGYKLVKTVYTTGTFENDDKMAVFIYKKVKEPAINKYSLTERFVDEDGNEISPSENKGNDFKTGDTFDVSLDGKSINGYKLTRSEGTIGTFTDSDKVATFIYKKETPSKPETPAATVVTKETHEAIRTIRVHYPDGKIDTIREVGHVERTVTTNTVTGEKTYGDWTTDTWEEFESPELEGWKADINIVMEEKVYFDTKDEVVDIHYTKDVDPEKPIIPSKPETPNKSNVPTETPNNKTPEPQKATPAKEEPKTQAATLPQTGEESNKSMGVLGLLMMGASSMLGLLGAKKKRKDEE